MEKEKEKEKKRISVMYILGGGILKEDFIIRHTRMIVLIVFCFFSISATAILV